MVSCRLCGYQGRDASSQCPVCGEAYDSPQGVRVPGPRLAQAGGGLWCGGSQQDSRFGVVGEFDIAEAAKASTHHLNLDLQSLLRLIPEQQDRRKRAQRDVVWATEAGLAPDQANGGRRDPDVVYIQPRVDPTMTVLKGRYNTQPRMAKATSMSVLNRLAHPLMGYDSIGALAPKARKRRQESVERLLGQATAGGESKGDGQARQLNKSHSAMHLSGPPAKNTLLRSRSSRSRIAPRAPMAVSVNAVHLHGRKTSRQGEDSAETPSGPGTGVKFRDGAEAASSQAFERGGKGSLLDRIQSEKSNGVGEHTRAKSIRGDTGQGQAWEDQGSAGLEWKSSTAKGTDTHETDITMAPAWGVLGSYEASPLPEDAGARFRAWQGREPGASTRPCSEWQLLRSGGVHSLSRSAELLRSFENKVGSPLSADEPQPRRPASAAPAAVSKDEGTAWQHQQQQQQQQQQQPLLPEGDHDGGRQRHHRQLPLPREQQQQQQQQQQRGGTPPSPSKSRSLASMHNRPGSSSWVHRRSLPSLLNHGATEGPTRTRRAKASSTPPTEPPGGPTARRRGKRRTPLEEPSGRMQRLDMTSVAVTVGDALSRSGLSLRCGGGENRGWKSPRAEAASARSFVGEREAGAATPPHGELEGGLAVAVFSAIANGLGRAGYVDAE
eukprot:g11401.t1